MPVTSEAALLTIYKAWYTDKEMENLLWRSSPVAKALKKVRIGGKEYRFSALYGHGGGCAGDMTKAVTQAANGVSKNAEFVVTGGQMFSVFPITQQEIQASMSKRGAYEPAAVVKMFAATDALRKMFAASLYGSGFGEIGNAVVATTVVGSNTVDFLDESLIVKLDVDTVFRVTNGATPGSSLRSSVNTVTAVNGTSVTFTATAIETWAATDWVEYEGSRSGASALLPTGLSAWLPTIANRTGGTWTSYIGTAFYGVDRSVFPDRLAGGFILRDSGNNEKYSDAITRGIRKVRMQGGEPDMIVVNDKLMFKIIQELEAQRNYYQSINGSDKSGKNEYTKGISAMRYAFSTSYLDRVYDDPFCPYLTGYILDSKTWEFVSLSNVDTPINDTIADNAAGTDSVSDAKTPDMQYRPMIEDYITIKPGADTTNGPAFQVSLNLWGNWACHNPAHNCVINFVS